MKQVTVGRMYFDDFGARSLCPPGCFGKGRNEAGNLGRC